MLPLYAPLNIGSALTASINTYTASNGQGFGLFYPDMGVMILNPEALAVSVNSNLAPANSSITDVYHNNSTSASVTVGVSGSIALLKAMASGSDFQARRTEKNGASSET